MSVFRFPSSHDAFFKQSMIDLRIARDFFQHHLPPYLLEQIDLSTLSLQKDSFIEPGLNTSMADLLYAVHFNTTQGFLYILAEHQSHPDRFMPFRILKYMCRILDQHVKSTSAKTLPPIYPMLFYNGKAAYPYSLDFFDLFGEQRALAKTLWLNPTHLIDIGQLDDALIKQHQWAGIMEWVMKHIWARDMLPYLEQFHAAFHFLAQQKADDYLTSVLSYLIHAANIEDKHAFMLSLSKQHLPAQVTENIMTLAELFKQEGLQQGIQQGMQQGIQQGMQQGIQQGMQQGVLQGESTILLEQLHYKFKDLPMHYRDQILHATASQLVTWSKRLLDAKCLDDIFEPRH